MTLQMSTNIVQCAKRKTTTNYKENSYKIKETTNIEIQRNNSGGSNIAEPQQNKVGRAQLTTLLYKPYNKFYFD